MKDPEDVVCWGAMEIGGPAYQDFVLKGKHPMENIITKIGEANGTCTDRD